MNGETPSPAPSARPDSPGHSLGWRRLRRGLIALAAVITLIALFYTEENVRGKRAWDQCKRAVEASGVVLDWDQYIPPTVPDDQNFFKAPGMSDWFVGRGQTELSKRLAPPPAMSDKDVPPLVVAEVTIAPTGQTTPLRDGDVVLDLADPASRGQALQRLQDVIGPNTAGRGAYGFTLVVRPLDQIKPARFVVRSDRMPTIQELQALFPTNGMVPANAAAAYSIPLSRLQVLGLGDGSFRVRLTPPPRTTADFLAWGEQLEPEMKAIREALRRPYARIDCDYQIPETIKIPNFVTIRQLVQFLGTRADCDYLLGQPEKALEELTLLNDSRRIVEAPPTGKPMTLVASMIDVAVAGLYGDTIADGLRMHAWREPQLVALQEQLKEIDLFPVVGLSVKSEPASVCRTIEATPRARLSKLFFDGSKYDQRTLAWLIRVMPRGWFYQNMVAITTERQKVFEGFDVGRSLIRPRPLDEFKRDAETRLGHFTPYTFLAGRTVPNWTRALQTLARQQTLVNQALVACALERYHLAHGDYPDSLETLSPKLLEKIPNDLIGGQPLKYRRLAPDQFLLYSVGWNETDDGGQVPPGGTTYANYDEGDWVWR